jgi:hypothetical protein
VKDLYANMVDKKLNARNVEEVTFVSMVDKKLIARNVEEVPFVSMVYEKLHANYVNCANMDTKQWTVQLVK